MIIRPSYLKYLVGLVIVEIIAVVADDVLTQTLVSCS